MCDFGVLFDNNKAERDLHDQGTTKNLWDIPQVRGCCWIRGYTSTTEKQGNNMREALDAYLSKLNSY